MSSSSGLGPESSEVRLVSSFRCTVHLTQDGCFYHFSWSCPGPPGPTNPRGLAASGRTSRSLELQVLSPTWSNLSLRPFLPWLNLPRLTMTLEGFKLDSVGTGPWSLIFFHGWFRIPGPLSPWDFRPDTEPLFPHLLNGSDSAHLAHTSVLGKRGHTGFSAEGVPQPLGTPGTGPWANVLLTVLGVDIYGIVRIFHAFFIVSSSNPTRPGLLLSTGQSPREGWVTEQSHPRALLSPLCKPHP